MADRAVRSDGPVERRGYYNAENIQGTIWNMFGGSYNGNGDFFSLAVPRTFTLTRDWFVLSDKVTAAKKSNQEFLTSTPRSNITTNTVPEPSTYALLGTGMLAVMFAARAASRATTTRKRHARQRTANGAIV